MPDTRKTLKQRVIDAYTGRTRIEPSMPSVRKSNCAVTCADSVSGAGAKVKEEFVKCMEACEAEEALMGRIEKLENSLERTIIEVLIEAGDYDPLPPDFENRVRERFAGM